MAPAKRVAVIGAGPAGAIALDALVQEHAFDLVRVFERREAAGGCWIGDDTSPNTLKDFDALAKRTADPPLPLPRMLPSQTPKNYTPRFEESSIYPYLETNVDHQAMMFSKEAFPSTTSQWSRGHYGESTPFRPWKAVRQYIQDIANQHPDLISFSTTVERVEKQGTEWKLTLRKEGQNTDYWWNEYYDAVIVANGHYHVPYIPKIEGLEDLERLRPGTVIHSKHFRGRDVYRGRRVVVVGASVSAADIAFDLAQSTHVHAITVGHKPNGYFGAEAFNHPRITNHVTIERVCPKTRTVHLVDGTSIANVDHLIFGTGYSWSLPFLAPAIAPRNNRVPGLWQHVVYADDPSLLFVGAVGAGLTFKVFEWQAVYAARLLAGRAQPLPSKEEMDQWEKDRIAAKGDGPAFTLIHPDFEAYFETLRELAGPGEHGLGRKLPPFKREWHRAFVEGHELRKNMWRRVNAEATAKLSKL